MEKQRLEMNISKSYSKFDADLLGTWRAWGIFYFIFPSISRFIEFSIDP
jgi:hypothetical protein